MKLIIYPDVDIWNFVLSGLRPDPEIHLIPLNRSCNLLQRAVRKFSPTSTLPASMVIGQDLRKALRALHAGDSVVLCEYTESSLVTALAKCIPSGVTKYLWLWNHKGKSPIFKQQLQCIEEKRFKPITFDEADALMYDIKWHRQFFCIDKYAPEIEKAYPKNYDFLFVGYRKTREEEINQIHSALSLYKCQFITVTKASEYLPYAQYMDLVKHTRCIVEIVHSGETACTLRPLEALALHRKLLTNNPQVRNYTFYHPQNIFIIGLDDPSRLSEFLNTPFVPIAQDIVSTYDVNHWISSFV